MQPDTLEVTLLFHIEGFFKLVRPFDFPTGVEPKRIDLKDDDGNEYYFLIETIVAKHDGSIVIEVRGETLDKKKLLACGFKEVGELNDEVAFNKKF